MDKLNPDRTVSDEKRIVHDQRGVNSAVVSAVHPPALQPYHRQLARLVLHWQSRYPRLPVLLATTTDIRGAFRLLWIKPEDCELFGGEVPWRPLDMSPGVEAPSSCGAVAGSCEEEGTASSATGVAGEVTGASAAAVVERDRDEPIDHPVGVAGATVTDAGTSAAVTRDRYDPLDHPSQAGGESSALSAQSPGCPCPKEWRGSSRLPRGTVPAYWGQTALWETAGRAAAGGQLGESADAIAGANGGDAQSGAPQPGEPEPRIA